MKIILSAIDVPMLKAWKDYCGDLECVTVRKGSILDLECDAIASPANSFGFMDGGIDLLYSRRFGWRVQYRLQNLIRNDHHGELLVGTAEIVETDDEKIPYLIAAPTMRVPMELRIGANPYLAARAALLLIRYGEFKSGDRRGTPVRHSVSTVAFPGLGTGVGGGSLPRSARVRFVSLYKKSSSGSARSLNPGRKRRNGISCFMRPRQEICSTPTHGLLKSSNVPTSWPKSGAADESTFVKDGSNSVETGCGFTPYSCLIELESHFYGPVRFPGGGPMFASPGRRGFSVFWLLPFLLLSITVLLVVPPAHAGKKVTVDGVLHVQNSDTPSEGREKLMLEEVWRIGGDDEEGLLLAMVPEVCGDEQGNIYVLDAQLCQVHVFSPEGELLRTIFRQGEGPGETLRPRDMVITKDGVGVVEEFPAKIIMVDRTGLPTDNIRPVGEDEAGGNLGTLIAAEYGAANLVVSGTEISRSDKPGVQDRVNFLASFSAAGEERARYCEAKTFYDLNDMRFNENEHTPSFWWGFTVDRQGNVYVAVDREAYAISVFKPDGTLDRVIERTFEPYTRTESEKKRMHDLIESALGETPFEVKIGIEDNEPVVDFFHRGLRVDDDGNLWVTSSRGVRDHTDGAMLTYDVFDPEGNYRKQVAVMCEGNSYHDCLFWVSKDQVVLVTGAMAALAAQFGGGAALDSDEEEATPQEIICYNVRHSSQTN